MLRCRPPLCSHFSRANALRASLVLLGSAFSWITFWKWPVASAFLPCSQHPAQAPMGVAVAGIELESLLELGRRRIVAMGRLISHARSDQGRGAAATG